MSRGPGRIERAIQTAFANVPPLRIISMPQLVAVVYPDQIPARKHTVSILRAINKHPPEGWRMHHGMADTSIWGQLDWTYGVEANERRPWVTWWERKVDARIRSRMDYEQTRAQDVRPGGKTAAEVLEAYETMCANTFRSGRGTRWEYKTREEQGQLPARPEVMEALAEHVRKGGYAQDFYIALGEIPPRQILLQPPYRQKAILSIDLQPTEWERQD